MTMACHDATGACTSTTPETKQQTRLRELWETRLRKRRSWKPTRAPGNPLALDLLGTPGNPLAWNASDYFPQWHLEYRIAKDGKAYTRDEYKEYYGQAHFSCFWADAPVAKDIDKHKALLILLRTRCDKLRSKAVLRSYDFTDNICRNIENFLFE